MSIPLLTLVIVIADIFAFYDLLRSKKEPLVTALWALLILFAPAAGVLLYFLIGRKK